ncbi:ABC transporter substrate-binding protein [Desulfobulbus marinus]|nr:ABC transporter substrate-binding protein [Desulfogranum marinum]
MKQALSLLIFAFLVFSLITPHSPALAKENSPDKPLHSVPQRIISLGPINTENVYLLGADDRLVANTSYCVRPAAAKNKQKIGSVMQVSLEKIISLKPDLVLATGLTQQQQLQQMKNMGLRVVQFQQPSSFKAICNQFLQLGQLLGVEKKAQEIVEQAQHRVQAVTSRYAALSQQKIFLQIGSQPLFSSVKGSFTNDYIVYSNGINIAANQKNGTMNYERVLAHNPDVIIIAIMGTESGIAAMEKKKWYKFSGMKAVLNNRIHIIDPDLVCSPSPTTFAEALEQIALLIHPESST